MPRCSTACRVAPTSSTRARPSSAPRSRGGSTTRACTSTCAPAASSPWPSAPASRRTGSACTATTRASPRSATPSTTASSRIVVDSFDEIERVAAVAAELGVVAPVLVRVTVGVEAHTHEFIATAHEDQKFGLSLSGGHAFEAARRILAKPETLRLLGLHSHIGSQIFDTAGFEVSARRIVGLHTQIARELGVELPELDLGGGFGIAYTTEHDPMPPKNLAAGMAEIIERECRADAVAVPRISIEPGRAIAGPSTFTLYEVGTVKPVDLDGGASRLYVSVDGGMSDNVRTALYDANYSCTLAGRASDADPVLARVVGRHCESGDIVVKDEFLPGDVGGGRPHRRPGHRRLLPVPVEPVQPHAPPAGRRGPRRGRPGHRAARDRSTTCSPSTSDGDLQILRRRCPDRETMTVQHAGQAAGLPPWTAP